MAEHTDQEQEFLLADDIEIPDTEPVEGFIVKVPFGKGIFETKRGGNGQLLRGSFKFTDEVEEMMKANLIGDYYILGEGLDRAPWETLSEDTLFEVFLTNECDHMFFKMFIG